MTITAKLRLLTTTKDQDVKEYALEFGSNVIGRGRPTFISDNRISRSHADIVVSKDLSQVTYTQLHENKSLLTRLNDGDDDDDVDGDDHQDSNNNSSNGSNGVERPDTSNTSDDDNNKKKISVKITKGQTIILKNDDHIYLNPHVQPLVIVIEDDMMESMETNIDDECATQIDHTEEFDDLHDDEDDEDVENNKQQQHHANHKPHQAESNNINNNNKRERDDDESHFVKKLRVEHPSTRTKTVSANTTTTTTTTTSTVSRSKKDSSPVYVTDESRMNLSEDELVYVKQLGKGSCGEVSLYEWRGTQVAVKIIFRSLLHKEKNGEFEKETLILKCLRHPNVVLFMGTCLLKGNLAIITEYLNSGSLRHVLDAKKEIGWNTKVKMCLDIAQGMNYLHTYNPKIIHRDLKSVNLLVDNNYNVKVSDFGLSRFSSGNEVAKTFCGTLPWIAPEVFGGSGYSTKADVFSFGVVLWEILTHKTPSGNIANSELGHPVIPDTCPLPYAQLIKDCCKRKPEDRPDFQHIIGRLKSMFVIHEDTDKTESNNGSGAVTKPVAVAVEKQTLFNWRIDPTEISDMKFIKKTESYILHSGVYKTKQVLIKQMNSSVKEFELKELDILASLTSPRIFHFYGVVYNDKEFATISEYTPNMSLLDAMKDETIAQSFTWENTLDVAIQVAVSINELHQHKPAILHRGITNESFVFDIEKSIKITDFGLSRFNIHENDVSLGLIKGKFMYSPPELFFSKKYSTKSDVYSYSIVLWELIQRCINGSYQVPFSHLKLDYDFQIIHHTAKYNKRPLVDETKVPLPIQQLLKQCWDADPQNRPDLDTVIKSLESFKTKIVLAKGNQ
ncbi:hypothetical protein SAMD00019534_079050 [Acytostelium subglobosum LB1]|uniref:hypothetical protein n=1 Tax=Acytostelium subglobosum LB1 TaxID=1410327 RepID=UPI0006448C59|nr:hypothetical protein SAMD00019534_079050 [Acytostelium subglobosum LB1]GAM24730.1 hypothetical protein SAMD00019534_079050 [Acytostelium subglobosum LB1]|eukprot:XP_012752399.1 hypothetical protein SAMD00019534_079050 [Acytostelium subglobosum LB1]